MRTATYVVKLKVEEKQELEAMLKKGKYRARELRRARALLMADASKTNKEILKATGLSEPGMINIKKRYCVEGLQLKEGCGQSPRVTMAEETDKN